MNYQIWVKRRFWFGFSKFWCWGFETENVGNSARLVMTQNNGVIVALPKIDRREFRVYPNKKPDSIPSSYEPGLVE